MELQKIISDLQNIEVKLNDEDKTLFFLSLLPRLFEYYKDDLLYGKEETINLEDVQWATRTNELIEIKKFKC